MSKPDVAYQIETGFYPEAPHVRRLHMPPEMMTYEALSDFGKELYRLSEEIAEDGEGLHSEEELERELARRRGGYLSEDDE